MNQYKVGDRVLVTNAPSGCENYLGKTLTVVLNIPQGNKWITETEVELRNLDFAEGIGSWRFLKTPVVLGQPRYPGEQPWGVMPLPVQVFPEPPKPAPTPAEVDKLFAEAKEAFKPKPHNKYMREVAPGVFVDVYDVLYAFNVTDPCLQHLIKKALATGVRGHKSTREDLIDIRDSAIRAVEHFDKMNQVDKSAE